MKATCADCQGVISPRAGRCPHCGAPGPARDRFWRGLKTGIALAVFAVVMWWAVGNILYKLSD